MAVILRLSRNEVNLGVKKVVARIIRISPFGVPSGIPITTLTEAGSFPILNDTGSVTETLGPTADGQVWISDSSLPKKGKWASPGGGGGEVTLTNQSGSNGAAGDVAINYADADSSFTFTTTRRDRRVIGVLTETINNAASGKVAVGLKLATVNVQGNVSRGMWLIASATTKRAEADGYTRPPGAIGMAMTAYSGGGAGTVVALIAVDLYLGASKGKGYVMGGTNGAALNTAQILSFITEITTSTASANLTVARSGVGSGSSPSSTPGYVAGGTTGADSTVVDKTNFSTDVTAAIAALPTATDALPRNISGSLACYYLGGHPGGAYSANSYKTTYSTDVSAAQASANRSAAIGEAAGAASGTIGYVLGGYTGAVSAVTDKMPFATETTAAQASANLSAARFGAAGVYSTTDAYALGGSTGADSAVADKMPFATEVTAAKASANLSLARRNVPGLIGALAGFAMGGGTGGYSAVADKLTYSTDTTAANAASNLPTAAQSGGSLSTINY